MGVGSSFQKFHTFLIFKPFLIILSYAYFVPFLSKNDFVSSFFLTYIVVLSTGSVRLLASDMLR
ncbi:hypothetical protein F5Y09DRAFT_301803 [Xylaria sp. FL1042]|nr:hypothetical protein F5Y09DRAFT_301803 [Xylaria sp. FL1042]